MRSDFQKIGLEFDYNSEINTCDPNYYKWTQWIFLKMYDKGLAYRSCAPAFYDPVDRTYLANEQINDKNGTAWRSGAKVETHFKTQWFLRTRNYTARLLDGLKNFDTKNCYQAIRIQKNWLGENLGYSIDFELINKSSEAQNNFRKFKIPVFINNLNVLGGNHPIFVTKIVDILEIPEIKNCIKLGQLFAKNPVTGEEHQIVEKSSKEINESLPPCFKDSKICFIDGTATLNNLNNNNNNQFSTKLDEYFKVIILKLYHK